MITKELVDYLRIETARGVEQAAFFALLKEKGWTDGDIFEALDVLKEIPKVETAKTLSTESRGQKIADPAPSAPTGRIREYFEHFSPVNMLEFSFGIVISLWQIYSLTYITYFSILYSSINVTNYVLNFIVLIVGIVLIRSSSHRAQKRYIDALVGKR